MKLPNGDRAYDVEARLHEYSLNPTHPDGLHKARVFASALGITADNPEVLIAAIYHAAEAADISRTTQTRYGVKYELRFMLTTDAGTARIVTSWQIDHGTSNPRLVTCYVE